MQPTDFLPFVAFWNRQQKMRTPRPHRIIAQWLAQQWESVGLRMLLMAFRGCGKSTLVALFVVWLLVRDPNLRIIVVAADMVLAEKMVGNIRRIIEKHPLARRLLPRGPGDWARSQFTVRRERISRDPSVIARSVQTNITGSRADIIICDDVEVPATAATPMARIELRARLRELEYVLVPGGTMIYIGTPHSHDSIYAEVPPLGSVEDKPFLENFVRLSLPLLDACGQSAWPERFTPVVIEKMQRTQGESSFASQMMLKPMALAEARLNPDRLVPYDDQLDYEEGNRQSRLSLGQRLLVGASCWWDPAFSGTRDQSVVALVFTDALGNYYLHRLLYVTVKKSSAEAEAQQQCDQVADFIAKYYVPGIHVESNGVGKFLPGLLRQTLAARGNAATVQAQHSTISKVDRILKTLEAPLAAGVVHAHGDVLRSAFPSEMREWSPLRRDARDDALDAVAGAMAMIPLRIGAMAVRTPAPRMNWQPQMVLDTEKPFQF